MSSDLYNISSVDVDAAVAPQTLASPTPASPPVVSSELGSEAKGKVKRRKGKKNKISKADISAPSNIQHLTHVRWDEDTNQFDVSFWC
jgi:hypothetical protein